MSRPRGTLYRQDENALVTGDFRHSGPKDAEGQPPGKMLVILPS
ncbi:MAG TPA: hypothetical protein VKZ59_13650 [Acidobacteriota bacterium]|nr:hypothetical protein [Acidobacteriota bacterium]